MKKRNWALNFAVAAFVLSFATMSWHLYDDLQDWFNPPQTKEAKRLEKLIIAERNKVTSEKIVDGYKEFMLSKRVMCTYLTDEAFKSHVEAASQPSTTVDVDSMLFFVINVLHYQGFYVHLWTLEM